MLKMSNFIDSIKFTVLPRYNLKWRNIIILSFLHIASIYAALIINQTFFRTIFFESLMFFIMIPGITAGAHRLWAHRSYKAKPQLRLFLVIANLIAFQGSVYTWVRDHRVHHRYSETNSDPHNAKRGFFFSHVGWLLVRKNSDVIRCGQEIDLSDIEADGMLMFQHKYYFALATLMCIILPTLIPLIWGEALMTSYAWCLFRYTYSQHVTWLVNSAAHKWGNRPYDVTINPSENVVVSLLTGGEGFHNYHHTFPYDYSTSEFGPFFNPTTLFIDFMAKLGLAYDLKTVSKKAIQARKMRTGNDMNLDKKVGD